MNEINTATQNNGDLKHMDNGSLNRDHAIPKLDISLCRLHKKFCKTCVVTTWKCIKSVHCRLKWLTYGN